MRALELRLAQLQAQQATWQAEKLGFEWHVQKLEAGEMRAREALGQYQARAEGLERELHMKALANADLERQVKTIGRLGFVFEAKRTVFLGARYELPFSRLLRALPYNNIVSLSSFRFSPRFNHSCCMHHKRNDRNLILHSAFLSCANLGRLLIVNANPGR